MEPFDLCVSCGGGVLNIRVGAIIRKDGRLLMAGSEGLDYLYTDGGRTGYLRWVAPDEDIRMYPAFFKTEPLDPTDTVRHLVTDRR